MSFILDALKKSESDRQRQSGPGLYEVKVAAPRSQLPYWAIGVIVLLGINLIIVAWALLRRPSHGDTRADAQAANTAVTAPPVPTPAAAPAAFAPPAGSANPSPPTAYPAAPPTSPASSAPAQPSPSLAQGAEAAATGSATLTAPRQGATPDTGANPDDYAPAAEPTQAPGFGFHVKRATGDGVPLYSQVATAPGPSVPELRLDLHAYAAKPEERFVLINMKRLREGDSLPDGVRVESITPDGVILSHHGARFLLPRD